MTNKGIDILALRWVGSAEGGGAGSQLQPELPFAANLLRKKQRSEKVPPSVAKRTPGIVKLPSMTQIPPTQLNHLAVRLGIYVANIYPLDCTTNSIGSSATASLPGLASDTSTSKGDLIKIYKTNHKAKRHRFIKTKRPHLEKQNEPFSFSKNEWETLFK